MPAEWSRREILGAAAVVLTSASASTAHAFAQAKVRAEVYKDPACGCCTKWVEHMNANGFDARVVEGDPARVKARYGIASALQSCHTAIVGAYVIEGHVPAADVKALLSRKPAGVVGLTIPGMPASAPGMDLTPFQPYTVLAFDKAGKTTVFAKHDKA